jgi:RNA polymerase subunit RPABC4/transcription elongation factor Spt4
MDLEGILTVIQPFVIMFAALFAAFLTAVWISVVLWTFRDIRARTRDVFAQILATIMVLIFFPFFPFPGLILYFLLRPRETLSEVYERSLEEEALLQGIEERLACPGCNRRIEEEFMVCPTCHTRLKKACPACGHLLHLRWNICPYCGAVQTTAKAALPLGAQPVTMPLEPVAAPARLSSTASAPPAYPASEAGPESWADGPDQQPVEDLSEPSAGERTEQPVEEPSEPQAADTTEWPADDQPGPESAETEESPAGDELDDAEELEEDSEPRADTLPFEFD